MDAFTFAVALLAVFALIAIFAGAESRDGFDGSDHGRSIGR